MSAAAAARPLALTLGEPAGIGPDIAIAAWQARRSAAVPPFLFTGDAELLTRRAAVLGAIVSVEIVAPEDAIAAFPQVLPCLAGAAPVEGTAGRICRSDTAAVIDSIRVSVALAQAGRVAGVVTNPIQKKALAAAGFPFPGHTEFLGSLTEELFGVKARPVMMLVGGGLRVVPVTVHIPLATVPGALTTALIVETGRVVARDLTARFGIAEPRLAVAGLNPHAGEEGMLGGEDDAIVRPALAELRAAGIDATGPLPADTMFHRQARATYDAALCMYHDQALIPVKTLAFDEGVNVTLGLPFIRTSPDHGTALSLAGAGSASGTSLVAALRLADELVRGSRG